MDGHSTGYGAADEDVADDACRQQLSTPAKRGSRRVVVAAALGGFAVLLVTLLAALWKVRVLNSLLDLWLLSIVSSDVLDVVIFPGTSYYSCCKLLERDMQVSGVWEARDVRLFFSRQYTECF